MVNRYPYQTTHLAERLTVSKRKNGRIGTQRAHEETQDTGRMVFYDTLKERAVLAPVVDCFETIAMVAGKAGIGKLSQEPMRTDMARNIRAKQFMEVTAADGRKPQEADTLIMLDNDHIHDPFILIRLAQQITDRAGGRGVVAGLAVRRKPPFDTLMFKRGADGLSHALLPGEPGLYEVDALGHGAIAIARWVFEDLEAAGLGYPFWRYEYDGDGDSPSEDMYFCKSCSVAGISLWVDSSLVSPHLVLHGLTDADTRAYAEQHPEIVVSMDNVEVEVVNNA